MNILCMKFALLVLLFGQQSLCMQQLVTFTDFSQLEPNVQMIIMRFSYNQASIQQINKYWAEKISIKTPGAITDNFCITHPRRVTQILLNAAYVQNYQGVENIVKNSCFLTQNPRPHICIDKYDNTSFILDLYSIARDNDDQKLYDVLKQYNISLYDCPSYSMIIPTKLMMNCLAGNSTVVTAVLDNYLEDSYNKKTALKVAIDYDHGKCINALLENMLVDSSWVTIEENRVNCKTLLTDDILWRAIDKLKLKALEALLVTQYFNLNKLAYMTIGDNKIECTLLNNVKLKAVIDPHYKPVVALLKKYGAKIIKKVKKEREEAEDVAMRAMCVIS